jgi:tetratricopeptide (TPR) repeat protein
MTICSRLAFRTLLLLALLTAGRSFGQRMDSRVVSRKIALINKSSKDPSASMIWYFRTLAKEDFTPGEWLKSLDLMERSAATSGSDYYAQLCAEIGRRLYNEGRQQEAFYYLIKAQTAMQERPPHDKRFLASFHESLGLAYLYFRRYDNARSELEKALFLNRKNEQEQIGLLNTMGIINRQQGYADSSKIYFEKALKLAEKRGSRAWTGILSGNLGNYYAARGEYEKAYDLSQLDYRISLESNELSSAVHALRLLIELDLKAGRIPEANTKLSTLNSLVHGKEYSRSDHLSYHSAKMAVLEAEGAYREALDSYRTVVRFRDTIARQSDTENLRKTEFQLNFEREQAEVRLLRSSQRYANLKMGGVVLLSVIIIAVALLSLRSATRRRKREKELATLRHDAVMSELKSTEKEMRTILSNLMEKNSLIEELTTEIESFHSGESEQQKQEKERMLDRLQSFTLLTDDDWLDFKKLFERLNPGFFGKVLSHFPDLTNAEIRLAALIKLNLSNLEMSRVLGISPDSVRKSGLRLRKKLEMDQHEDLVRFILTL